MKLVFFLFMLLPGIIFAECDATPETYRIADIPKNFVTTNNLYRKTGSPLVADGSMIIIKGTLTDEECVPITNADISIWQVNAYGKYQYDNYDKNDKGIDKNFGGTGSVTTNNLGQFSFITIFPGEYTDQPPVINLKIQHVDYPPFSSRLFFSDKHPDLKIFSPQIANRLVAIKKGKDKYEFNIAFVGTNKYLEY